MLNGLNGGLIGLSNPNSNLELTINNCYIGGVRAAANGGLVYANNIQGVTISLYSTTLFDI